MGYRALLAVLLMCCLTLVTACAPAVGTTGEGLTYDQIKSLSYEQVKGTGLANKCPQLSDFARGSLSLTPNQPYQITDFCLEPTSYFVKEEPVNKRQTANFVPTKLLTRATSSLDAITGDLQVASDGVLTLKEQDGIDFQVITVQLPGGERVPFFFTIKELVAKTQPGPTAINTSTDFSGAFQVPSYRSALFLDPKGRGVATGYDNAVALPGQADDARLGGANVKTIDIGEGHVSLNVAQVDGSTGEIAGTFESEQPSDTDLGAREPLDVKIRGIFYARVRPAV
ncbi:Photosystem II manganese-stabilizing protein PsbO [Gloeomargarita lithophora Alchichica-D10]|uniref:Photosystem II extrinsic protein O n=1 Tax=Gloeomargarita lithophora Alchichica-D10 TaxID=1188229 RepID=A0A1J0AAL7_9CYAN|nr:photosystem II manganese-stabilizing polypeptide [Gloeomargarita lithophora]APB32980.1 Photosystem II manganese-stabilizing protein PsbO [Gloeomargarita lithophora Alchichica-D10]